MRMTRRLAVWRAAPVMAAPRVLDVAASAPQRPLAGRLRVEGVAAWRMCSCADSRPKSWLAESAGRQRAGGQRVAEEGSQLDQIWEGNPRHR